MLVLRDCEGAVCGGEAAYEVCLGENGDRVRTGSLKAAVRFFYGTAIEEAQSIRGHDQIAIGLEVYDTWIHGAVEETIDVVDKTMPQKLLDRLVEAIETHSAIMTVTRSKRKRVDSSSDILVKTEAESAPGAIELAGSASVEAVEVEPPKVENTPVL